MMNTLLFKLGTMVFVGGSTVAAFLASGLCPDGKPCADATACPTKAKVVAVSTVEQTQDARVVEAAYTRCAKTKQAAMASKDCAKDKAAVQKVVAKSGCKYSKKTVTQVAQNAEQPEQVVN